jgi:DNA-binding response OmpR family regulator
MQQILVIDNDIALCQLVAKHLEPNGYKVETVYDSTTGAERALSGEYALAVLDYSLPGMSGLELLRHIRAHSRLPVVMVSAGGHDIERIIGLQIGADDYLTKPFNPLELVARIEAVLRRTKIDLEPKPARNLVICFRKNLSFSGLQHQRDICDGRRRQQSV